MNEQKNTLEQRIQDALLPLKPNVLRIENNSNRHKIGSNTHYTITLVSDFFDKKPRLLRHQCVMEKLSPLFSNTTLHAVQLTLKTPQQWQINNQTPQPPACAHTKV